MFQIVPSNTSFDFAGKRKFFLGLSAVLVLATFYLFFTKGLNYGIDFTGGAEVQVHVPSEWTTGKIRKTLIEGGLDQFVLQSVGLPEESEYLVKVKGDENTLNHASEKVESILRKVMDSSEFRIDRVEVVGPAAGGLLRKQGALAMIYALIAILIYVAIRFDSRYAPGAVIALFHDSMITIGIFIFTQKQFDLTTLAALLALIGYSNNDTIIVFDRVRETLQMNPTLTIEKAVNMAVNETLGRTLVTSLTTFFVVSCLWVFGGAVLENFAFTLMIGVLIGTYSSVFIASSAIISITHYWKRKQKAT